jgi:hypothetical protein
VVRFASAAGDGSPIGVFSQTDAVSGVNGDASAVFSIGRTKYRGEMTLIATVDGTRARGKATILIENE